MRIPNVPRWLCNVLIGKHHTPTHRGVAGVTLMAIGVTIAKHAPHSPFVFALVLDGIGYFLHGLGAVPFVESWTEQD